MKRLILYFLLVFIFSPVYSQEYFNLRFGFTPFDWVPDGALSLLEIEDGFIINGGTGDPNNPSWLRLGVAKLDFNGNVLWRKSWGDTTSVWYYADRKSLVRQFNAYYSIGSKQTWYEAGSHGEMVMIKYNDDFDTIWTAYYGKKTPPYDTSYIPRSFIAIPEGFMVVGSNSPNYGEDSFAFLLRTDSLGNVIWEQDYGDDEFHYLGLSMISTPGNGYAIGGYKFVFKYPGVSIGDPIIIKTDSLGNEEWELNLGGQYQDSPAIVCESGDGNIFAVSKFDTDSIYYDKYLSRIRVSKISNDGTILSDSLYGPESRYLSVNNCRLMPNGDIIVCGALWNLTPDRMGYLFRISEAGDSLWYRQYAILYGGDSRNYFYDAIPVFNGGFLAGGYCFPVSPDEGTQDAWVIKVDSLGCESPTFCWVGETKLESKEADNAFLIYPNPARDQFKVQSEVFETENCRLEIVDLLGRKAKELQIPKGESEVEVSTRGWKKGLYVVKVTTKDGKSRAGKILIR